MAGPSADRKHVPWDKDVKPGPSQKQAAQYPSPSDSARYNVREPWTAGKKTGGGESKYMPDIPSDTRSKG